MNISYVNINILTMKREVYKDQSNLMLIIILISAIFL